MKIRYEFITGEVMEIEVDEVFGEVIDCSRRELETLQRKERKYCISLSQVNDKSNWMLANENNPSYMLDQLFEILEEEERLLERKKKLYDAIDTMSPRQRELIEFMLSENVSQSDFAESRGLSKSTVSEHFAKAKEKIKKIF